MVRTGGRSLLGVDDRVRVPVSVVITFHDLDGVTVNGTVDPRSIKLVESSRGHPGKLGYLSRYEGRYRRWTTVGQ